VDSSAIPVDSSGMPPFLQESVGHDEVLNSCAMSCAYFCMHSAGLSKFGEKSIFSIRYN
jgi:hypothetical protein